MSPLPIHWYPTYTNFRNHPKRVLLSAETGLSVARTRSVMHELWSHCCEFHPTGTIPAAKVLTVLRLILTEAEAVLDPKELLRGLLSVGFAKDVGGDLMLHDWYDYAGKLIEQRAAEAEKKRNERAAGRGRTAPHVQRESQGSPGDIQGSPGDKSGIRQVLDAVNAVQDIQDIQDSTSKPTKPQTARAPAGPYHDEFAALWPKYPKRFGSNSHKNAAKCYAQRRQEGLAAEYLTTCTNNYRIAMERAGKIGTETVMQAQRFYGPNEEYKTFESDHGSPRTKPVGNHYTPGNSDTAEYLPWISGTPEFAERVAREKAAKSAQDAPQIDLNDSPPLDTLEPPGDLSGATGTYGDEA